MPKGSRSSSAPLPNSMPTNRSTRSGPSASFCCCCLPSCRAARIVWRQTVSCSSSSVIYDSAEEGIQQTPFTICRAENNRSSDATVVLLFCDASVRLQNLVDISKHALTATVVCDQQQANTPLWRQCSGVVRDAVRSARGSTGSVASHRAVAALYQESWLAPPHACWRSGSASCAASSLPSRPVDVCHAVIRHTEIFAAGLRASSECFAQIAVGRRCKTARQGLGCGVKPRFLPQGAARRPSESSKLAQGTGEGLRPRKSRASTAQASISTAIAWHPASDCPF